MPIPNLSNPICPICGNPTTFNKLCPSGAKQYRCRRHTPNYTCTDSDRPVGGQMIGDRKLTPKEKKERWKERDPIGFKAAQKRYNQKRLAKQKASRKAKKIEQ